MDYHALTKKCDGMCDSCECPPAELADPSLKPDIAALTTRLAEDTEFAAQVTGKKFMAARISADPALLERCIKAETEAALLRVGHRFSVGRIGLQDDLDAAMTDPKPAEPAPATPSTDP